MVTERRVISTGDWWREAEATYVLCVIAGRAFALCLFVLMMAAGVTVFLSPDQFGGADMLLAMLLFCALSLLILTARRMGDALALYVVRDGDPRQSAPLWIRMSVLASALVATSGLVWLLHCARTEAGVVAGEESRRVQGARGRSAISVQLPRRRVRANLRACLLQSHHSVSRS